MSHNYRTGSLEPQGEIILRSDKCITCGTIRVSERDKKWTYVKVVKYIKGSEEWEFEPVCKL